jgi:outer membrane protein assembly factor BamB
MATVFGIFSGVWKMLNNVQRWSLLFAVLCVAAPYGAAAPRKEQPRRLIDPVLLSAAGMEVVWHNQLPLKPAKTTRSLGIFKGETVPAESMASLTILANRLYALSDRNYLASLNRYTGTMVFGRNIASASFTVRGMDLHGNEIVSVIANRLVEIDPEFGTEKRASEVPYGIVGTAARNSGFFYLAGTDKRLRVLRAEDKLPLFEVAARDDSMITAITAADDVVIFGTDSGKVVAMEPGRRKELWTFNAAGAVAGQIVRSNKGIFVASRDTNVYKLDVTDGGLLWRYQAGAILDREPHVTESVVYQYLGDRGLAAVSADTGKLLWEEKTGLDLLAEADGKAYIITKGSEMAVMDNRAGRRLRAVNFAGVAVYATNLLDSSIYVADAAGLVACLKPVE